MKQLKLPPLGQRLLIALIHEKLHELRADLRDLGHLQIQCPLDCQVCAREQFHVKLEEE